MTRGHLSFWASDVIEQCNHKWLLRNLNFVIRNKEFLILSILLKRNIMPGDLLSFYF